MLSNVTTAAKITLKHINKTILTKFLTSLSLLTAETISTPELGFEEHGAMAQKKGIKDTKGKTLAMLFLFALE
jgi:hypothetical protein